MLIRLFFWLFVLICPSTYGQVPRYVERLTGAPLALVNMDAQSTSWGLIQSVAPTWRKGLSAEGNPAFFTPNHFQSTFHASHWALTPSQGSDTFRIWQYQGSYTFADKHQVSWGVKTFLLDTTRWMEGSSGRGSFVLNQVQLKAQQYYLNYSHLLNNHWQVGATVHYHRWPFIAQNASASGQLVSQWAQNVPVSDIGTGFSLDVGTLYKQSISLKKGWKLHLQTGAALVQIGPPVRWHFETFSLIDYLPTAIRTGSMGSISGKLPESEVTLHLALGYEWEKRLIDQAHVPNNSSYL